jgi:hypothetical protein
MLAGELHVNATIQGIDVPCVVEGRVVRALIPSSVLEEYFGASPEPRSWIATYESHTYEVDQVIRRKACEDPSAIIVVVLVVDFPPIKPSCRRAD